MDEHPTNRILSIVGSGVLAAELLERACESALATGDSLPLEVVRDLARDLKSSLESTSRPDNEDVSEPDLLAESALRCADLANLAACNVAQFPTELRARPIAAVQLAAGTTKALVTLAEKPASETLNTDNVLRDLRSAGWRAGLAVRQVEGLLESSKLD